MWKCLVGFLLVGVVAASVYDRRLRSGAPSLFATDELRRQCARYGNEDKFEEAQRGVYEYTVCALSTTYDPMFRASYDSTSRDDSSIVTVRALCSRQVELAQCYSKLVESLRPCSDPKSDPKAMTDTLGEVGAYICDNNAKRFVDFINDGALTCLEEQTPTIQRDCKVPTSDVPLKVEDGCTLYEEFTDCMVSALSKCPNPSTAKFTSEILSMLSRRQCPGSTSGKLTTTSVPVPEN